MNAKRFTLWMVAATVAMVVHTVAQVPEEIEHQTPGIINYQGMLVGEVQGHQAPYADGLYRFDIRLYRSLSGGVPVWGGVYSTYVKDGYFNIMLGGPNGSPLADVTYPHDQLWMALWPDPAVSEPERNTLFLGLTPWHDVYNVEIPAQDRVELAPRQQLLATPYAMRAQTAEYANRAPGAFEAGGRITAPDLTIDGLIGTSVSGGGTRQLNLGGGWGSTPKTRTYLMSDDVHLWSGDSMQLTGWSGPMELRTYSSHNISMIAGGKAWIQGAGAEIRGGTQGIKLFGTGGIEGNADLRWRARSSATTHERPFRVTRHSVSIASGGNAGSLVVPGSSVLDTTAMIVGVHSGSFSASTAGDALSMFRMVPDGSQWKIEIRRDTSAPSARSYAIDVLWINTYLADDAR